jgi:outer membrane protein OmpA-like peptidoglycan-associated protein
MINRLLPILLAAGVLFTQPVQSQWWKVTLPEDVWLSQIGFSANLGLVQHQGIFSIPESPVCCAPYEGATGATFSLSLFARHEITKHMRLTLRGTFVPMNGSFTQDQKILVTGGQQALTRSYLDTKMNWLGGEFLLDFRVVDPLRIMGGVSFGSYLSPTYSQKEILIEPSTGTFENGRRERNETTNQNLIGIVSPAIGAVVGVGYDIPMTENHSVVMTPELLYTIPFSKNIDALDWTTNLLRAGVSVAFTMNAPEPPIPVERRREEFVDSLLVELEPDAEESRVRGIDRIVLDTVVGSELVTITERAYRTDTVFYPRPPELTATIKARAVEASGALKDVFTINVSTQYVTEALPVLPAVFFDPQTITISPRYHQVEKGADFKLSDVAPRTTAVHRDILNIIGERMQKNPNFSVRLRGTADPTTESSDCDLAQKRANAVKEYLIRVWGIADSRIAVQSGGSCAPDRPTRRLSEEGYAENRRVEIFSDNLDLLASVAKRRFNEARTVDPPRLQFDPTGTSTRFVTDWELEATSGAQQLFAQSGKGLPSVTMQDLSITVADKMRSGEPVDVRLKINGIRRSTASATTQLVVKKDTMNTELERLTLTLFEVASDEISTIAEEQIRTFVENVPTGSTVIVRGFADMLGNAEFNKKLSQKRADAVCETIKKYLRKKVDIQCNDITTDKFPPGIESYATPEERFLSRTVQIEVKKTRK